MPGSLRTSWRLMVVAALVATLAGCATGSGIPTPGSSAALPTDGATTVPASCRLSAEPAVISAGETAVVVASGSWSDGEGASLSTLRDDGQSDQHDAAATGFVIDGHHGLAFGWPGDPADAGHSLTLTVSTATCSASATIRIVPADPTASKTATNESPPPAGSCVDPRPTRDRPDDAAGEQVHLIYAIPRDAIDRRLDLDGTITRSIALSTAWLRPRLDGRSLRIDTCDGKLDVSFVTLPRSSAEYEAMRWALLYGVEWDLRAAGFGDPRKIYLVVWGGRPHWGFSGDGCGGEAQIPTGPSGVTHVAINFVRDVGDGECPFPLAAGTAAGIQDLGMVHEVLHTLGFVASCAPHVRDGHATDSLADLMAVSPPGVETTVPTELDAAHDDYYRHGIGGCPDLAKSAFLEPLPKEAVLPPGWP